MPYAIPQPSKNRLPLLSMHKTACARVVWRTTQPEPLTDSVSALPNHAHLPLSTTFHLPDVQDVTATLFLADQAESNLPATTKKEGTTKSKALQGAGRNTPVSTRHQKHCMRQAHRRIKCRKRMLHAWSETKLLSFQSQQAVKESYGAAEHHTTCTAQFTHTPKPHRE